MRHLLPILVLLPACGEPSQDSAPPDDPGTPALVLSDGIIDFGEVLLGEAPSTHTLTLSNRGDATVHVHELSLEDPDQPFRATDIGSPILAPGEQTTVELAFEPTTIGSFGTFFEVVSDDPHSPSRAILEGVGLGAQLEPSMDEVDFGTLPLGCEASVALTLDNTGSADLTIASVVLDDEAAAFALQANALPTTLAPGEGVTALISYTPAAVGDDLATLIITSDDPLDPERSLPVLGSAEVATWVTDTSSVPLDGSFTLIIALDKSGGMTDEITTFAEALPSLFDALVDTGEDFRIAITQADDGCINGSDIWIDSTFTRAEATSTFDTMINLGGSAASNTERAFMLLEAALAEVVTAGCNEGLWSSGRRLHLMGVSDEEEQSVNSWKYYLSLFRSYDKEVTVHAIGGDHPKGCDGAPAYTNMFEAVQATGGQFHSICDDDWGPNLEVLAAQSLSIRSVFPLSTKPVVSTIGVTIDGGSATHWHYDAEWNTVVLGEASGMAGGEEVAIHYAEAEACSRE